MNIQRNFKDAFNHRQLQTICVFLASAQHNALVLITITIVVIIWAVCESIHKTKTNFSSFPEICLNRYLRFICIVTHHSNEKNYEKVTLYSLLKELTVHYLCIVVNTVIFCTLIFPIYVLVTVLWTQLNCLSV